MKKILILFGFTIASILLFCLMGYLASISIVFGAMCRGFILLAIIGFTLLLYKEII